MKRCFTSRLAVPVTLVGLGLFLGVTTRGGPPTITQAQTLAISSEAAQKQKAYLWWTEWMQDVNTIHKLKTKWANKPMPGAAGRPAAKPTGAYQLLYVSDPPSSSDFTLCVKFQSLQALPLQLGDVVWYDSKAYLITEIQLGHSDGVAAANVMAEPPTSKYAKDAAKLQTHPTAWLLSKERKSLDKIGPAATIAVEMREMQSVEAKAD